MRRAIWDTFIYHTSAGSQFTTRCIAGVRGTEERIVNKITLLLAPQAKNQKKKKNLMLVIVWVLNNFRWIPTHVVFITYIINRIPAQASPILFRIYSGSLSSSLRFLLSN